MMEPDAVLSARGLAVGHGPVPVLEQIEIDLPRGRWWALVGPNGCGKTTLIDTIAGRRRALRGEIRIGGHSLAQAPRAAKRTLGFVLSPDALPGRLTPRECIALFTALHDRTDSGPAVAHLVDAWDFDRHLDVHVDRCSLGTRQKLGVLLALVGDPRLLLMDESFNGLDPASGLVLKRFLDDRVGHGEVSVLLATHALDLVERHADVALLIDRGRIRARLDRDELRACDGRLDERLAERLSDVQEEQEPGET